MPWALRSGPPCAHVLALLARLESSGRRWWSWWWWTLASADPARARPGGGRYPPGDHAGKQDWTVCRSPGLVDYAKTWPPGHHVKERWWFRRTGGGQGQTRNRLGLVTVADTIKLFWGGLGVHISIPVD